MEWTINGIITSLNRLGEVFFNHSATMLLQSSILICILLILNLLLRKHTKAVWRYCLWMILFAKLVLPPSFACPTGIAYWVGGGDKGPMVTSPLHEEPVPAVAITFPPSEQISSGPGSPSEPSETAPEPTLSTATAHSAPAAGNLDTISLPAVLLLCWVAGVILLSLYLARRVWFVMKLTVSATDCDGAIGNLVEQCRSSIGLGTSVRVRVSSEIVSPSVCGVIRPVILLPKHVAGTFSVEQLRPILIHELMHIKRCDIFVNFAQTLLHIFYFYNPLLWAANAIVRRIREQAVDEAVLVALGDKADSYSNALIDIAEAAMWRPNLGLRLISVAESEKHLARRIRHIAEIGRPKSARIGALGSVLLVGAAAMLLPMAQAEKGSVITVAADGSADYTTVQAAVDAATPGATIKIAAGMYEEHVMINKALTLEGAGSKKTTIMTVNRGADAYEEMMQDYMRRYQSAKDNEERKAIQAEFKAMNRLQFGSDLGIPVISVTATEDVVIRNMKLKFPGRVIEGRVLPLPALKFSNATAKVVDCVVVDSAGDGIHVADGSDVEIRNCLVAAVWSTGILVASGQAESSTAKIIDSDIRNCYHRCIAFGKGTDSSIVKGCRISGSAWHGIRYDYTSPLVTDNIIFSNARNGIYASGTTTASVKGNVFFSNDMGGMSCWSGNGDTIEGNTFIGNEGVGVSILGKSKPTITMNIFAANPTGISFGNIESNSPDAISQQIASLSNNIFWESEKNVAFMRRNSENGAITTEDVLLDEKLGNIEADPLFADLLRKNFSLKKDSPARRRRIGVAKALTLTGDYPIQPEETAIIPDGDTRDSRKWKIPAPPATATVDTTESK